MLDEIPGANAGSVSGLAITGYDLYWFNCEEGSGISLAHASLDGSGSTVDRHFLDHAGYGSLVRPTAKTESKLKSAGAARVAVELNFTPPTGAASDRVVKLKLSAGPG